MSYLKRRCLPNRVASLRKSDQALHDAIMLALSEMKEDGTAADLSEKWFGKDVTTF